MVVIDVLRATSSICVAFANGVKSIVPVPTMEESFSYKVKGAVIIFIFSSNSLTNNTLKLLNLSIFLSFFF